MAYDVSGRDPRSRPRNERLLLMLPCLISLAALAPKDQATEKLRLTERAQTRTLYTQAKSRRAASDAAAREAALSEERIQAAAHLQSIEDRVRKAKRQADEAAFAQNTASAEVEQRSNSVSAMLPLALRLSVYPAETLLATPATPQNVVEGLLATHGVSTEVVREFSALQAEQEKSRALAALAERDRSQLDAQRTDQARAASVLDRQISKADQVKAAALNDAAVAAQAGAVLAAQAEDLRSAIAAMDAAEQRTALAAARAARGQHRSHLADATRAGQVVLRPPAGPGLDPKAPRVTLVAGHITRGWGAPSEVGPATGVTYSAVPGAFVVSPCAGRVAFAAPFRSYGQLMIIECGRSYDFVIAGMDRLDAAVGRTIRAGEPIGRMPSSAEGGGGTPLLYVELRKNGGPTNPLPYLNGKP